MVNQNLSERERDILALLARDSGFSVAQMSAELGVSTVTIRSRLNGLARKGIIMRSRGGASLAFHPEVIVRQGLKVAEKSRIAQAAASLIRNGDTIMIEAGTTTSLVAKFLLGKRDIHLVTNSTLILPYARTNPALQLTVVGGFFRPATESMVGPLALEALGRFHVRLAFVGTDGFSPEGGLTTHLLEGAEIVRRMAERAVRTVLVADSSKYGHLGFVEVLPMTEVDTLVSDTGLPEETVRQCREAGLEVILV